MRRQGKIDRAAESGNSPARHARCGTDRELQSALRPVSPESAPRSFPHRESAKLAADFRANALRRSSHDESHELSARDRVGAHMAERFPLLYIKPGCPWCDEAVEFLDDHGIGYELKDVTRDEAARVGMHRKSGQTKVPTLDWHGDILADFGVDELVPFLRKQNVTFEDS